VIAKKILIFLAINLVIAFAAGMASPSLTNGAGYVRAAAVLDFVDSADPNQDLRVILGDSRSECCVAGSDLGFVNLSYQGATPVEGYYLLKRMTDRGLRIDSLILSFGPFHIFTQDVFHSQTRYFGLLDQAYLDEVMALAAEHQDAEYLEYHWQALEALDEKAPWIPDRLKFRLVNVASIHRTINSVLQQSLSRVTDPEGQHTLRAQMEEKNRHASPEDRLNRYDASPESQKPAARSPVNEFYLSRMVELARQHGIRVHFLVMPFNRDVAHPGKDYYARYYAILDKAGLQGCYDTGHWWPNDLFSDEHHLNVEGTAKLGEVLGRPLGFCDWPPAGT
jgi:hypothetical protein